MALSGTLQTLSLAEIFQTLERSKATGVLRLVSIDGARDIILSEGDVCNVDNRDPNSHITLAHRMQAAGVIEDAGLNDAIGSTSGGQSVIRIMGEHGIGSDIYSEAITNQLMDELFDVFTWTQADFEFLEFGSGDPEIDGVIDESSSLGISIKTNTVLMESARRLDEWERARAIIKNEHIIVSQVAGRESELQALTAEYPARAIIPLINGVNSVENIINESVATRLDIFLKIAEYINEGLLLILSTPQIVANAQSLEQQESYAEAAQLYRRAIANNPDDSGVRVALAGALEKQGDGPEAAGCYAELALGFIRDGNLEKACNAGKRSVELGGGHFERQTYIQCLESSGRIDEATEQMRRLAEFHMNNRQWSEAKEVCHQVLSVSANDEAAMHIMSLAFIHTCDLALKEHEVACVYCSQINNRNSISCENCSARLHKLCRNCHSETACSDSVCLFCGKSPHILESNEQESGLLEAINDVDKEYRSQIQRAIDLRDTGDLEKALAVWKELAQKNSGSQSIHQHIRDLETEIHNQNVEKLISKGNAARRGRRYAKAVAAYKNALRVISPRDLRKDRLESILAATIKDKHRTFTLYGIAGITLLITGWLAAQPHIDYYFYEKEVRSVQTEFKNKMLSGGGTNTYMEIAAKANELTTRGATLSERVQLNLVPMVQQAQSDAREKLSLESLDQINDALKSGDFTKSDDLIRKFKSAYGATFKKEIITKLYDQVLAGKESEEIRKQMIENAPKLYQAAEALLKKGNYRESLNHMKELSESPDQVIAQKANVHIKDLSEKLNSCKSSLELAGKLINSDLLNSKKTLMRIEGQCQAWELTEDWVKFNKIVSQRLQQASLKFKSINASTEIKELESFISSYPGTTESDKARQILNNLRNEVEAVNRAKDKLQKYEDSKSWEQYHLAAKRLMRDFGKKHGGEIDFPLIIDATPEDAIITIDGKVLTVQPYRYKWADDSKIEISKEGFDTVELKLSQLKHSCKYSQVLNRKILKTINTRGPSVKMLKTKMGILAASKSNVSLLNSQHEFMASIPVGNLGFLADNLERWASFIFHNDEIIVIPTESRSLTVTDQNGETIKVHSLKQDVGNLPLVYINELFGADWRLATSNNGLAIGDIAGDLKVVQAGHRVMAGPMHIDDGQDVLLVFVSHTGQFIGFDEANGKVVWTADSGAAHIGSIEEVAPLKYITTLDDSRLAMFEFNGGGVVKLWEKPLPKSIVAEPLIQGGMVYLPLKEEVVVYNLKGIKQLSIKAPEGISAIGAHNKAGIAIANNKNQVLFYSPQGELSWVRSLESKASSLLVIENRVFIGTNTSQVFILAP